MVLPLHYDIVCGRVMGTTYKLSCAFDPTVAWDDSSFGGTNEQDFGPHALST